MLKLNVKGCESFVDAAKYDSYVKKALHAFDVLESEKGAGNDFLGWKHLPSEVPASMLREIEDIRADWAGEGSRFRAMGRELVGLAAPRASFPTLVKVTGVCLPAREADTTTESRRSVFSCACAQKGSTRSAARSKVFFISLRRYEPYQVMRV